MCDPHYFVWQGDGSTFTSQVYGGCEKRLLICKTDQVSTSVRKKMQLSFSSERIVNMVWGKIRISHNILS